jgi:hypothetical protein
MILPILILASGLLQAATINPCPTEFKPEERTVVVYATNDKPNSKAIMHEHFKNIVQLFRKNNVRTALPLFQAQDAQRIFIYAVASQADTQKMIDLDPLIKKQMFSYKLETWIECKSVKP